MDGLDGAGQSDMGADLLKGQIRSLLEKLPHLAAVGVENDRLAPAAVMERSDVAEVATLLEEFFHHGERHLETAGDRLTRDVATIISIEDALAEIHGKRSHGRIITVHPGMAILLFKML